MSTYPARLPARALRQDRAPGLVEKNLGDSLPPMTTRPRPLTVEGLDFTGFYHAEYRAVVGLGYVLGGNRGLAEDLAQEAFAEAHRRWDEIAHYDNPGAWVRRVMINRSRSKVRRLIAETKAITRLAGRPAVHGELPDRSEEVWAAVRSLPTRQGQAIALRYWDDLGIVQIAEILGCSTETVKTHLKRGRAALADQLGAEHGPDLDDPTFGGDAEPDTTPTVRPGGATDRGDTR